MTNPLKCSYTFNCVFPLGTRPQDVEIVTRDSRSVFNFQAIVRRETLLPHAYIASIKAIGLAVGRYYMYGTHISVHYWVETAVNIFEDSHE